MVLPSQFDCKEKVLMVFPYLLLQISGLESIIERLSLTFTANGK